MMSDHWRVLGLLLGVLLPVLLEAVRALIKILQLVPSPVRFVRAAEPVNCLLCGFYIRF
jgi:hypothetical protein